MRAIKIDKKAANPVKSKRTPLSNEDHARLAKVIVYINNNLSVMRAVFSERRVQRRVVSGLDSVQSAVNRLNHRLQGEYQVHNKLLGPYPNKVI